MLKVYGMSSSGNCHKVKLALTQLARPFDWIEIDSVKGETRTPAYLAMNPNGKVPVLEIEPGLYLPESNAILWYLAEGAHLLPDGQLERAQVLQWMFWEQYSHEPYIAVARFILKYLGKPAEHAARFESCLKPGKAALDLMESHLTGRDFFVGEAYSIADIALYAYTHVADEGGFDLAPYPAIRAWLDRVSATPGFLPMLEA
jgi:glutathione S-transferase